MATFVSDVDPFESIQVVIEDDDESDLEELLRGSDEPPAIRLVNAVIMEALRLGASDIHIQPRAKNVSVRYRIDGVLQEKIQVPLSLLMPIVSRIKVIAELDISERRRPQDGRITVKSPTRIVDLRISTLPTINGEKVVMRVLDRQSSVKRIEQLGFSDHNLERVLDVVTRPQGIILATGPTGSGKTTTLYAMLQHDASEEKNYVTIEDPVEFYVDMAGQVPVRERIGLDFATVLRAILRQDPDVVLLGEIRDEETSEVAFHAALTGHVVYSTLHTNSATATIARLLDLGLKPYIVAQALEAIIAQRLLRRVCEHCKEFQPLNRALCQKLGFDPADFPDRLYVGKGCGRCNGGYSGRVPIHEVLVVSEEVREAITEGASAHQLYGVAQRAGMKTLVEDARLKVIDGATTMDEVLRVMGSQAIRRLG
jgi:type II secretory ATPase GspE/PulE/Tfp pilus assembly ATPase PilB-like protein